VDISILNSKCKDEHDQSREQLYRYDFCQNRYKQNISEKSLIVMILSESV